MVLHKLGKTLNLQTNDISRKLPTSEKNLDTLTLLYIFSKNLNSFFNMIFLIKMAKPSAKK